MIYFRYAGTTKLAQIMQHNTDSVGVSVPMDNDCHLQNRLLYYLAGKELLEILRLDILIV